MKALLFGSIGTLCDTSGLQLESFNRAFSDFGLEWRWDEVVYRSMLGMAGGQNRMRYYADQIGDEPDEQMIADVHARKSALFQEMLATGEAQARPGVVRLIKSAADAGLPVGIVTSTELVSVERTVALLGNGIGVDHFAVVTHRANVEETKPDPAPYFQALRKLDLDAGDVVAIEDTEICIKSTQDADIVTLATPNENSVEQDFSAASSTVDHLGDPERPATHLAGIDALDAGLVTLDTLRALLGAERRG